ncbi:hypothetical protein VKT23_002614 [Stygiomarasmius scandens]|uniref:Beta-glucuronidase C-terminal domain-containing protein n=1 Tax=Marasmiellus scandens TaxID=2682957 RepID=A0ABR1K538_9AGAR
MRTHPRLSCILLSLVVPYQNVLVAAAIRISPPASAPDGAKSVSQGFLGFGIEGRSFADYAGTENANEFSKNLLSTFSSKTGVPVHIRVGGTTTDHSKFDPAQTNQATKNTTTENGLRTNITFGTPWVEGFKHWDNVLYTLQVPFARKNLSNAIELVRACINAMPNQVQDLEAIEIGNEPNLYPGADRNASYSPANYAREWDSFAGAMLGNISRLNGKEWFQAMAFAWKANPPWTVENVFDANINRDGFVKTVSQHYYQGRKGDSLTNVLMNHTNTVSTMRSAFQAAINSSHSHGNTPFVLGEVGSALEGGFVLGNSLGAALWTVDFMLHSMTMGIKRVSMQLGTNFDFPSWQPITVANGRPAAVHGNFYGQVFVADFIGKEGNLSITALSTDGHPNVVPYAGYNSGRLSKVAIIDLQAYDDDDDRPTRDINLTGLDDGIQRVRVGRLTALGGSTTQEGVTWAGKQWTKASNGTAVGPDETVVLDVKNGSPVGIVTIRASEALLVEIVRE